MSDRRLGRFGETSAWILVALRDGRRTLVGLLDDVRSLDGRLGPGTLFGAVARLEGMALIESMTDGDPLHPAYRATGIGAARRPVAPGRRPT